MAAREGVVAGERRESPRVNRIDLVGSMTSGRLLDDGDGCAGHEEGRDALGGRARETWAVGDHPDQGKAPEDRSRNGHLAEPGEGARRGREVVPMGPNVAGDGGVNQEAGRDRRACDGDRLPRERGGLLGGTDRGASDEERRQADHAPAGHGAPIVNQRTSNGSPSVGRCTRSESPSASSTRSRLPRRKRPVGVPSGASRR